MTAELEVVKPKKLFRKITVAELNELGYELTGKQIPVGDKPFKYAILEVKNEDSKKKVGFSYVFSIDEQTGIILNGGYDAYLRNPLAALPQ